MAADLRAVATDPVNEADLEGIEPLAPDEEFVLLLDAFQFTPPHSRFRIGTVSVRTSSIAAFTPGSPGWTRGRNHPPQTLRRCPNWPPGWPVPGSGQWIAADRATARFTMAP